MAACHAEGLLAGVWETMPRVQLWSGLDFYIAELERPIDTAAFAQLFRAWNPTLPAAYITNLDTHGNPSYFVPMDEAGFVCITEVYSGDDPNVTVESMENAARHRGITRPIQPCFGVGWGRQFSPDLAYYLSRTVRPGWSIYLAEYVVT